MQTLVAFVDCEYGVLQCVVLGGISIFGRRAHTLGRITAMP